MTPERTDLEERRKGIYLNLCGNSISMSILGPDLYTRYPIVARALDLMVECARTSKGYLTYKDPTGTGFCTGTGTTSAIWYRNCRVRPFFKVLGLNAVLVELDGLCSGGTKLFEI